MFDSIRSGFLNLQNLAEGVFLARIRTLNSRSYFSVSYVAYSILIYLIRRKISLGDVCGSDLNLFAVFTNCFESSLSKVHWGLDVMQMVDVTSDIVTFLPKFVEFDQFMYYYVERRNRRIHFSIIFQFFIILLKTPEAYRMAWSFLYLCNGNGRRGS
jgi:hypothetical protein